MSPVFFLDYDGCLHPDNVRCVKGAPLLLSGGHQLFEHVQLLVDLLEPYSEVRIVLSTLWARVFGLDEAKSYLPATLQERVVGTTYEFCTDIYEWNELSRFDQIVRYVNGKGIQSWLALDDNNHCWPESFENRLVCPNRHLGLGECRVQEEFATKLAQLNREVQQLRQLNAA
ncbi:HAD domain-containing protein [Ralstonia nicotianae]|uniref:Hydrolase n=1 Tax=Ralstonia nicotianae TaxID=3037696 RepID=A0ABX7ZYC5_9RALS|nr:HAD domain-containing protein [Ralstonia nicotianae]QUP59759.1 hypothetical protein GO999_15020 [Ralstonia nicotianae]